MTEAPSNDQALLKLGIGIIVAIYGLVLIYALIFAGTFEVRSIVRIVLAVVFGWLALGGRRWAGWVLIALTMAWTAEQLMWGFRGALDSFLAAFGFLAAVVVLVMHMMQTRVSS
jgi:hypothetical protein